MNRDQISGKIDQATGKVKEKAGETFHDEDLANRGVAEQLKGVAKETWGNAKDAAHEHAQTQQREMEEDATDTRERIVNQAQDVKDRVNEKIENYRRSA